jgi:CII-binding regulator of phage lambda lysogenization HflD
MFKIARNMLQREKMNLALNDLTNDPEDQEFAESVKERISIIEKEISNWSKEVSNEISELVELDEDIIAEALQDRIDVLRVEGKLQEIDTRSQQQLIHSLEILWKRSKDTGLEPNQLSIEKECKVFIDNDTKQ